MMRKSAIVGSLLLVLFLGLGGLLEPRKALAFCDASVSGDDCLLDDNGGTGGGPGGSGPCQRKNCIQFNRCNDSSPQPVPVYCTCDYYCPSGILPGVYAGATCPPGSQVVETINSMCPP